MQSHGSTSSDGSARGPRRDDPLSQSYYFAGDPSLPLDLLGTANTLADLLRPLARALEKALAGETVIQGRLLGSGIDIKGPVHIAAGAVVHSGVSIEGPVYVGGDCSIRHGAQLRAGTILGQGCIVGHGAEIKSSVCMAGSKLQSGVFIGNSILGLGARVGSGTIIANRRFDQGPIRLGSGEISVETDLEFAGAVMGDYARLGANAVTAPGTLIGPHSWVASLVSVAGFVPRAQLVSLKQELRFRDKDETPLRSGRGEYEHL